MLIAFIHGRSNSGDDYYTATKVASPLTDDQALALINDESVCGDDSGEVWLEHLEELNLDD